MNSKMMINEETGAGLRDRDRRGGQRLLVISLQGNTVAGTLLAVVSDVHIRRWVVQSFNSMVMSK